jgi:hypothetical protein
MKTLKSIGAILAGFVTVVVLSILTDLILHKTGVMPEGPLFISTKLLLLAVVYRTIYTILGGFVTAWLAPEPKMRAVYILAVLGIVAGAAGAIANADLGPAWYPWTLVVLALPSVWLGGKLYLYHHGESQQNLV